MRTGDICRMRSWTVQFKNRSTRGSQTFSPENKKDVGVFVLLGTEPKDGSRPLDIDAILNEMGWHVKKSARTPNEDTGQ